MFVKNENDFVMDCFYSLKCFTLILGCEMDDNITMDALKTKFKMYLILEIVEV